MTKVSKVGKWLAGLACVASTLVPGVHGEAKAEGFEFPAIRTRVEQTSTETGGVDKTVTKFTLGASPNETPGWYFEKFRLYDCSVKEEGKKDVHYTVAGFRPTFNLGRLALTPTIFKEFGHELHEGQGIQLDALLDNTLLTLNWDEKKNPESRHYGVNFAQRFGTWKGKGITLGLGLDKATVAALEKRQALAYAEWDATATDQFGLALRKFQSENTAGPVCDISSVLLAWLHYGQKEKWGNRAWVEVSKDDVRGSRTIEFNNLFAQNPSLPRVALGTFLRDDNDARYTMSTVEYPFPIERTPLPLRVRNNASGFASDLYLKHVKDPAGDATKARIEVAYRFGNFLPNLNPGASLSYEVGKSPAGKTKMAGFSVILPWIKGKKNVIFEIIPRAGEVDGKKVKEVYVGGQISF